MVGHFIPHLLFPLGIWKVADALLPIGDGGIDLSRPNRFFVLEQGWSLMPPLLSQETQGPRPPGTFNFPGRKEGRAGTGEGHCFTLGRLNCG